MSKQRGIAVNFTQSQTSLLRRETTQHTFTRFTHARSSTSTDVAPPLPYRYPLAHSPKQHRQRCHSSSDGRMSAGFQSGSVVLAVQKTHWSCVFLRFTLNSYIALRKV